MLLVCFNLCLALCAYLVKNRGAESRHNAERASESVEEPAEIVLIPPEALRESILSTEGILSQLDPPDMWHEEYVYQDSCISLSMNYSDGIYEIQVTSRKYADDVVQNTLSISRPK